MKSILSILMILVGLFLAQNVEAGQGGCCSAGATGDAAMACNQGASSVTPSTSSMEFPADVDVDAAVEFSAAIANALSNDEMTGVPGNARGMAQSLLIDLDAGETDDGLSTVQEAAGTAGLSASFRVLADESAEIGQARQAYMSVQASFIPLASETYVSQDGGSQYAVYHCSMANASWIQAVGPVANPYYGSKMLRCGSRVAALGTPPTGDQGQHDPHAH